MPLDYRVDHDHQIVVAVAYGVLTGDDMFTYQRTAWGHPDVAGYDELVDVTHVTKFAVSSPRRLPDLAAVAAEMDPSTTRSKFAIVAPSDQAFGLGRMFQSYRDMVEGSTKDVGVFRTMDSALVFLGIHGPLTMPEPH